LNSLVRDTDYPTTEARIRKYCGVFGELFSSALKTL
jgi:hypothetical protein